MPLHDLKDCANLRWSSSSTFNFLALEEPLKVKVAKKPPLFERTAKYFKQTKSKEKDKE